MADGEAGVDKLTANELGRLNVATRMVDNAQSGVSVAEINLVCMKGTLENVLRPIREKHRLPGEFTYDRETGVIAVTPAPEDDGEDDGEDG